MKVTVTTDPKATPMDRYRAAEAEERAANAAAKPAGRRS